MADFATSLRLQSTDQASVDLKFAGERSPRLVHVERRNRRLAGGGTSRDLSGPAINSEVQTPSEAGRFVGSGIEQLLFLAGRSFPASRRLLAKLQPGQLNARLEMVDSPPKRTRPDVLDVKGNA
jgi:hypothetical protein